MPTTTTLCWVFLGGCVGTTVRAGIGLALTASGSGSWAATLIVNVLGALLLGTLMARLRRRPMRPDWIHPTLVIGVLGSFTTYSALAVDAGHLGRAFGPAFLVGYPMLSLLLGLTAVRVGLWLGEPPRPGIDDAPC